MTEQIDWRARYEWLFENCKIVYFPFESVYPIEHNPIVRKNERKAIEHYIKADLKESQEEKI